MSFESDFAHGGRFNPARTDGPREEERKMREASSPSAPLADREALEREMIAQAKLGHKMYCVGIHPETEDSDEEAEWIEWDEAFAMLRRAAPAAEAQDCPECGAGAPGYVALDAGGSDMDGENVGAQDTEPCWTCWDRAQRAAAPPPDPDDAAPEPGVRMIAGFKVMEDANVPLDEIWVRAPSGYVTRHKIPPEILREYGVSADAPAHEEGT